MNKLTKFREIRFYQQNGRCHYCGDPMWTTDSAKFAKIYQVSNKQARWRQATAEHLIPRSKGGSDRRVNIRSEEHTSELQSLMRISYAVFCLKQNNKHTNSHHSCA